MKALSHHNQLFQPSQYFMQDLSGTAFKLLQHLLAHWNFKRQCVQLTQADMASYMGVSERTIRTHIARFKELKILKAEAYNTGKGCEVYNVYRLGEAFISSLAAFGLKLANAVKKVLTPKSSGPKPLSAIQTAINQGMTKHDPYAKFDNTKPKRWKGSHKWMTEREAAIQGLFDMVGASDAK